MTADRFRELAVTLPSSLGRSRGLVLQRTGDSQVEIQVERDRNEAAEVAFFTIVTALPTLGFAAFALIPLGRALMLLTADSIRLAIVALVLFGGMALGCGFFVWSSYWEALSLYTGQIFEIHTQRQVLIVRQGRRSQSFPFPEIIAVNLDSWYRNGHIAELSIRLRKPPREMLIQRQRLAEYRLQERLDEIAAVGQGAAALIGVPLTRKPIDAAFHTRPKF